MISFQRNIFLELPWQMRMILVFLEGLLTLSIVYEKIKIFEIIESEKRRGNADVLIGSKSFFSYVNTPDKILQSHMQLKDVSEKT